jgi:Cu(I)/Ag(I) efflux system membrane protein CusA/SilA
MPLGVQVSLLANLLFVGGIITGLMLLFFTIIRYYEQVLRFFLRQRWLFFLAVVALAVWGFSIFRNTDPEFMPSLDEGSFLLMPTSMPYTGMQQNMNYLRALDMAVTAIPEVESVVGKLGRVESALDPAPISMFENVILYKPEYKVDANGHRLRFKIDEEGEYLRDEDGELIPDRKGKYFRQWRDHIQSPDDIWNEIVEATKLPGVTSAPKLQPIETRLVMLQTGMRAPMGIKVKGPDLEAIEQFGLELERHLKEVEGVKAAAVFADRIVGKPYLELAIDREAIARHGLTIEQVQRHIQAAVGGMAMSTTVEGRERYPIRICYPREMRNDPESIQRILLPSASGGQIPLGDLVEVQYRQGPQSIKSEDGFLVGYVLFDRIKEFAEGAVVRNAQQYLKERIASGELVVPPGLSYRFTGTYEQQVRANQRLSIVLPIALGIIFLILYFQFRSVAVALMVFSGVFIAFAGGFIMIWLYGQPGFMDFSVWGVNMRDLFQMHTINLSVAVWVGFIALFGIATDDGVLVATFLRDSFRRHEPETVPEIRKAVVEGGLRRVRPAMMTTATTLLALLPVLTSTGRGADVMVPMAIPSFGGMALQMLTMFTVPVLYCTWKEGLFYWKKWFGNEKKDHDENPA